jgi:hypothetical protein
MQLVEGVGPGAETHRHHRPRCTICGGARGKSEIGCVDPSGGIRCCEACVKAGQDQVDRRLRRQIWELEHDAAFLRGLPGRVKVPSLSEWEAAVKAHADFWREAERRHKAETEAAFIESLKDGSGPWYPDDYPEDLKITVEDVLRDGFVSDGSS